MNRRDRNHRVARRSGFALASLLSLALTASADANHSSLVSTGPTGGFRSISATSAGASDDGTRIFFYTTERLVSSDTDAAQDVYERLGHTVSLISTGPGAGNSSNMDFAGSSADGTRVFFTTSGPLTASDTDTSLDVYERSGGTTTLISLGENGTGNATTPSNIAGRSQDGTRVFFTTNEALTTDDLDSGTDIFQRYNGTTTLISIGPDGGAGSFTPTLRDSSQDGARVFFTTDESLLSVDTDTTTDIYERSGSTTSLVSRSSTGTNVASAVTFARVSSDGNFVFFLTLGVYAAGDTDAQQDVYRRDTSGSTTTRISTGPAGGNGAFMALFAGASADGTRAFFATQESLVSGDTDGGRFDGYGYEAGTVGLLTTVTTGNPGGNGGYDVDTGSAIALDGSRVFFSTAESLDPSDTDTSTDVYERSGTVTSGTTTLVSAGANGPYGASLSTAASISADGAHVFFQTAEPLDPLRDTDTQIDVYERFGGATRLVSAGPLGGNAATPVTFLRASSDGARALYSTTEALNPADLDGVADVYVSASERATGSVGAGGGLTTGATATADDPFETSVTSPNAGIVTITETSANRAPPAGFTFADGQVEITAPTASTADPLVLTARIHDSALPSGFDPMTEGRVFRDGVQVLSCSGPGAMPDPCVDGMSMVGNNLIVTVRARTGGSFNAGWVSGRVRVVKNAMPNDAQDFDFTSSFRDFQLDDSAELTLPSSVTFNDVLVGSRYSVSETLPAGWTQTGASCDDGSPSIEHQRQPGRAGHLHVHEHPAGPIGNDECPRQDVERARRRERHVRRDFQVDLPGRRLLRDERIACEHRHRQRERRLLRRRRDHDADLDRPGHRERKQHDLCGRFPRLHPGFLPDHRLANPTTTPTPRRTSTSAPARRRR